jgi:hypothetical protein
MTNDHKSPPALSKTHRRHLGRLIAARRLRPLATVIGVHAQTLASVAAGITTNASTTALLERRLAEIAAEAANTSAPEAASGIRWPAEWDPEEGWPEVGDGLTPDGTRTWAEVDRILREHGTSLEDVVAKLNGGA